jgi:hypothetical protein
MDLSARVRLPPCAKELLIQANRCESATTGPIAAEGNSQPGVKPSGEEIIRA